MRLLTPQVSAGALYERLVPDYWPHSRTERLIESTRLALAAFSLITLALFPIEPNPLGWFRLAVVILYGLYSALLGLLGSRSGAPWPYTRAIHAVDVAACFLFLSVSRGSGSLFVPFFLFAVFAASLRWQWRGIFWTSAVVMSFFAAMGTYQALLSLPGFEIRSFLLDTAGLVVTAMLVGRAGVHERQASQDVVKLGAAPPATWEVETLLHRLTEWAAGIVGTPRVLIAWEEPDEPWVNLAWWDRGTFHHLRESPGTLDPLVAEDLAGLNFVCNAVGAVRPVVLCETPEGFRRWRGAPLNPALRARFATRSVLSLNLIAETLQGRLFLFDKPRATVDDLVFAEIVSRHVATRLVHLTSLRGFEQKADRTVLNERLRLARDLHDGALHSLAGVALELQNLLQMPKFQSANTQRRVLEVQQSLLEEQRNIRHLIAELRAEPQDAPAPILDLRARLEQLACRLKRQWGLRVECVLKSLESLPPTRSNEIYLVVHEGLINAARHAHGSTARLEVAVRDGRVTIVVADNGCGFEFKGLYDHATLATLDLGPATLRERVALLGGTLTVESTDGGARLEIMLPAEEGAAAEPCQSA